MYVPKAFDSVCVLFSTFIIIIILLCSPKFGCVFGDIPLLKFRLPCPVIESVAMAEPDKLSGSHVGTSNIQNKFK